MFQPWKRRSPISRLFEPANATYGNALAAANAVKSKTLEEANAAERTRSRQAHRTFQNTKKRLDAERNEAKYDAGATYSDAQHNARTAYSEIERRVSNTYFKSLDEARVSASKAQASGSDASAVYSQFAGRAHDTYIQAKTAAAERRDKAIEAAERVRRGDCGKNR